MRRRTSNMGERFNGRKRMAKIRKEDLNREQRRNAMKGFHGNVYAKKYHSKKAKSRAYKLFRGIE